MRVDDIVMWLFLFSRMLTKFICQTSRGTLYFLRKFYSALLRDTFWIYSSHYFRSNPCRSLIGFADLSRGTSSFWRTPFPIEGAAIIIRGLGLFRCVTKFARRSARGTLNFVKIYCTVLTVCDWLYTFRMFYHVMSIHVKSVPLHNSRARSSLQISPQERLAFEEPFSYRGIYSSHMEFYSFTCDNQFLRVILQETL